MNALQSSNSFLIDAVIFDLDGTLVDSVGDIANAVNFALQQLGLSTVSQEHVRGWIGAGLPMLCQRAAKHSGIADRWADIEQHAQRFDNISHNLARIGGDGFDDKSTRFKF